MTTTPANLYAMFAPVITTCLSTGRAQPITLPNRSAKTVQVYLCQALAFAVAHGILSTDERRQLRATIQDDRCILEHGKRRRPNVVTDSIIPVEAAPTTTPCIFRPTSAAELTTFLTIATRFTGDLRIDWPEAALRAACVAAGDPNPELITHSDGTHTLII